MQAIPGCEAVGIKAVADASDSSDGEAAELASDASQGSILT